jgi:hypothetical protein
MSLQFRRSSPSAAVAAANWEDVTTTFSGMPTELSGADGRKVRLTINSSGSDWGTATGTGASVTRIAGGAYDGTDCLRLVPPSVEQEYCAILRFLDLHTGSKNIAQVNLGFCIRYGSTYWNMGHNDKLTGVLASQTVGGSADATLSRAAVFDTTWDRDTSDFRRVFSITARTVAEYFNPARGGYWNEPPDTDLLMFLSSTINHANDPPQVGTEWLYFEQEVDYRQNRGNANGRNRLDVWTQSTGYLGYLEIPLTNDPTWDFSWQYARSLEFVGGYWNFAGTPDANNRIDLSHVIVANNRAKDSRIGPPWGS